MGQQGHWRTVAYHHAIHESAELGRHLVTVQEVEFFNAETIENTFKSFIERKEIGMGALLPCLRLILTGRAMGPSLFSIMELIGEEEVMNRFKEKSIFFENLFLEKSDL